MNSKNLIHQFLYFKIIKFDFRIYFTWKSQLKAPIYVDNRLIFSYIELRKAVILKLKKLVLKNYPQLDGIFGAATAGIAPAILLSEKLKLPCGYVRLEEKQYGRKQAIEGYYESGWKVIIIEDTISTGRTVLKMIDILKTAGMVVLGVLSIFSYNIAHVKFKAANIKCHTLMTVQDIFNYNAPIMRLFKNEITRFLETLNQQEMMNSNE